MVGKVGNEIIELAEKLSDCCFKSVCVTCPLFIPSEDGYTDVCLLHEYDHTMWKRAIKKHVKDRTERDSE